MKKDIAIRSSKELGTSPDYVLQPHSISRSIYNLSATARKLTAMAMAIIPPDLSIRTVHFTLNEFLKAVGLEKGGNSYKIFEDAVNECMSNTITIDTPRGWEKYTWFAHAKYETDRNMIQMTFSDHLADSLIELKKMYAKIQLEDLGKLSSRYALRIYELAISYSSMAGKNGNAYNAWYFEKEIRDLRELFAIEPDKYKATKDFRIRVIEGPVNEINRANIGIEIAPLYIRAGKFIQAVRFNCKKNDRQQSLGVLFDTAHETLEEKETTTLKKRYPVEYEELFQYEMNRPSKFDLPETARRATAAARASQTLRDRHGVRK